MVVLDRSMALCTCVGMVVHMGLGLGFAHRLVTWHCGRAWSTLLLIDWKYGTTRQLGGPKTWLLTQDKTAIACPMLLRSTLSKPLRLDLNTVPCHTMRQASVAAPEARTLRLGLAVLPQYHAPGPLYCPRARGHAFSETEVGVCRCRPTWKCCIAWHSI